MINTLKERQMILTMTTVIDNVSNAYVHFTCNVFGVQGPVVRSPGELSFNPGLGETF